MIAFVNGEPPRKAVAKHFRCPDSTAARWVTRARQYGYLGEAESTAGGAKGLKRNELKLPVSAKELTKWVKRHPNATILPRRNGAANVSLLAQT